MARNETDIKLYLFSTYNNNMVKQLKSQMSHVALVEKDIVIELKTIDQFLQTYLLFEKEKL